MRRALVATAFLALAFAATAAAKEMSVALASSPPALGPGDTWNATLLVHGEPDILAEATPSVTIYGPDGTIQTFAAKRLKKPAADGQLQYRAAVVFPTEGSWRYTLVDGVSDREYEGGTIQIGQPAGAPTSAPAKPTPVAAPADDGGIPAWPVASGVAAFVLLALAAAFALRRRSPRTA
jgi:hypothetical protein